MARLRHVLWPVLFLLQSGCAGNPPFETAGFETGLTPRAVSATPRAAMGYAVL